VFITTEIDVAAAIGPDCRDASAQPRR
jgi:hypothetical protein